MVGDCLGKNKVGRSSTSAVARHRLNPFQHFIIEMSCVTFIPVFNRALVHLGIKAACLHAGFPPVAARSPRLHQQLRLCYSAAWLRLYSGIQRASLTLLALHYRSERERLQQNTNYSRAQPNRLWTTKCAHTHAQTGSQTVGAHLLCIINLKLLPENRKASTLMIQRTQCN